MRSFIFGNMHMEHALKYERKNVHQKDCQPAVKHNVKNRIVDF